MQQKWKRKFDYELCSKLYLFFILLSNYSSISITVLTAYCSAMASKLRYDDNGIVGSDKQLGKHVLRIRNLYSIVLLYKK